jgi:hypothetical protein
VRSSSIHGKVDGLEAPQRAGGAGGMADLLRDCAGQGRAIFLFGGDSAAIHGLRERIGMVFPGLRIAGVCDADFAGPIDRAVLDHIAVAQADVIVTDLSQARFRLFCAQCAARGIYGKRINLPGGFTDFAFGPGQGFLGRFAPGRLRRFGVAAKSGLQFARIILGQKLRNALARDAAVRDTLVSPRRGGRG